MLIKHVIHLRILYFSLSPTADPVLLDDEKLVKLAKVVYKQEAEAAKHCKCNSEIEHSNSFRETKVCYNTVLGLLDSVKQLKKDYEDGDENLSSIANDIFSYVVYAVNNALQFLSNYSLRKHYLDKISENAKALIRALKEIDPNNVTNVQRLAKDAIIFRNAILEIVRKKNRPISRYLAKWLKETGLSFGKLTQRYQNKLNFQGQFRNLKMQKSCKCIIKSLRHWGGEELQ
ncbi:uncharacterized protein LOC107432446 [Ziziphus jujuba]|uniref:Uncharacterized protein LOC107432446 n=1 Tax=Ziziphus jujuba TaxID=326968 RepID=A0ABM3ZZZ1_ZIZJJ|nr:uncharacterized protein LOC107432446 [Ziziphus jujuba]